MMKKRNRKRISCLLSALLLLVMSIGWSVMAMADDAVNKDSSKPTVWIIGDSTVSSFADNYYYPRYGWGTQIDKYLDGTYEVKNIALSGRSSKSYVNDKEYKELTAGMKQGDYLLIGFGHNDEKAEADRYTDPNGDYKTAGSFANSLYENYIKPAQAAGTTVILCTPIVRRTATAEWSDSNLHITKDSGDFKGGDYAQSIRNLGKELNIPVVDMTKMTKELYDTLGPDETVNLHAWTSSKATSVDNTHTNIYGGTYNAYLVTKTIKELGVAGISEHITAKEAPVKADVLKSNPDYKEAEYSGELKQSELWKDAGVFKGSIFGDIGGDPNLIKDKFILEGNEDGSIHIAVNGKGKISSTTDGMAMYYYKVPADSNFVITANATVNSINKHNQVAFGLMARDAMYIDVNDKSALGDYVAAGSIQQGTANCFKRKDGALGYGGKLENPVEAGKTYALKIESNSDGYACTFGDNAAISGGFDFKLTSIDADYVYVGLFVARQADVTFSDIKLVVDGKVVTGSDVKPDDNKPGDNKPGDNKPGDNKPGDNTPSTPSDTPNTPSDTPSTPSDTPSTPSDTPSTPDSDKVNAVIKADAGINIKAEVPVSGITFTEEEKKEIENGSTVSVSMEVKDVTATVSESDKKLVEDKVKEVLNNGVVGAYLDLTLLKKVGSLKEVSVTETAAGVVVKLDIPESLKNTDSSVERKYTVVRIHDGVAEALETSCENGVITFTTDKFSTYAICYEDVAATGNGQSSDNTINTGDVYNIALYVLFAVVSCAGLAFVVLRRKSVVR
ncbi:MAG TPA: carbohydrate esterase family 12 protein [Eubacterium sp.]|jgi:lysophospholipase L1-like esterase|nr:carbohydrate esterase family 12 protein [Eubacterium sp.]